MLEMVAETKIKKALKKVAKNNALLIQFADGAIYKQMLDASMPRHKAYCGRYGIDFWCVQNTQPGVQLQWQKFALMLKAFSQDYAYVVYLDADCIILDPTVDLRDALTGDYELGMSWGQVPGGEPPHHNVGVIYAKNAPQVVALFEEMLDRQPETPMTGRWWENPTCEQTILNVMLRTPEYVGMCEKLASKWNCVDGHMDTTNAVVLAWHGVADEQLKLERLQAALNK